jgi:uncharacterized membrane protein YkvA (DUF1232 family)
MAQLFARWKERASQLKTEIYALFLAYKDPRTPWQARIFTALVVGYAFSPIDLIPDFIPVLGYLDDLVIVPLGIFLALKMIPVNVMEESRAKAVEAMAHSQPVNRAAAVLVVVIWLSLAVIIGVVVFRLVRR